MQTSSGSAVTYSPLYASLRSAARSSLWAAAVIAIPIALAAVRLTHLVEPYLGWRFLGFGTTGAQALLQVTITASLSFLVFTFGSLLVAIQVASGQMTPRIIATILLRNNIIRLSVAFFMFTLIFSIGVQNRMEDYVHQFPLFLSGVMSMISFAVFLYLIDYAARLLRPISVLMHVANAGLAVVGSVYPSPSAAEAPPRSPSRLPAPARVVAHAGTSALVLAVDVKRLLVEAERRDGVIEVVPQVGDFVGIGEPLFNLYGGVAAIKDDALRPAIDFGPERTMEQDPTFAFRIAVDIALKALSPAINDPTTAVLAIDQLHRLLRSVGTRYLRTDELLDPAGELRVILRTPNWSDFVNLCFTEIRACGTSNTQVARRLRAMIENLKDTIPAYRHPELEKQLRLLDRDLLRLYPNEEDRALAQIADTQGLGGHAARMVEHVKPTA